MEQMATSVPDIQSNNPINEVVEKNEGLESRAIKEKPENTKAKPTAVKAKPPTKTTKPKPKPPVKSTTKKPVTKNKTKNKVKNSSEKSKPRAKGTLYGLSSLRRVGDVAVNIMSEYTAVKSNFAVGPLILRVEKEVR